MEERNSRQETNAGSERKKITKASTLLLAVLVCLSFLPQRFIQAAELSVGHELKPFSDELAAMRELESNSTKANREALANIRSRHAIMLSKWAKKKGNMDPYYLALLYAQSATDLVPDNGDYWFLLGHLYWQMKGNMWTILMAEDALHKAVELNPEDDKSRLLLGQTLFYQDSFAAALEQFETVVKRNSKTVVPEVIAIMYSAYILDYQSAKGISFFQSLLKTQPDADSARLALAILLHQQEKRIDAKKELEKIITRDGSSAQDRKHALKLIEDWNKEEVAQ